MALTFPRTDFHEAGFFNAQPFRLSGRSDVSRRANGTAIVKNYGTSIWLAGWTTPTKKHRQMIDFEAVLNSLNDGVFSFYAYDLRRPYPKEYPTGGFSDSGKINSISATSAFKMSLKGLAAGFKLSRGDMLAFDYTVSTVTFRALHEISENIVADGSGVTTEFEVRPMILPGAAVDTSVTLKKPKGLFKLDAGSISPNSDILTTQLTFTGFQVFTADY